MWFWNLEGSSKERAFANLQATATAQGLLLEVTPASVVAPAVVEPTSTPTFVEMPTRGVLPALTPVVEVVMMEVTRIVPEIEYVPEYIYVDVPVEVLVEVPVDVVPTVVALAPGSVQICASVAGAKGLYVGGEGITTGECRIYQFGVGQTEIAVQVNR